MTSLFASFSSTSTGTEHRLQYLLRGNKVQTSDCWSFPKLCVCVLTKSGSFATWSLPWGTYLYILSRPWWRRWQKAVILHMVGGRGRWGAVGGDEGSLTWMKIVLNHAVSQPEGRQERRSGCRGTVNNGGGGRGWRLTAPTK